MLRKQHTVTLCDSILIYQNEDYYLRDPGQLALSVTVSAASQSTDVNKPSVPFGKMNITSRDTLTQQEGILAVVVAVTLVVIGAAAD